MAVKIERIGHCALRVRDVERARRFYVDVLGFELLEEDPDGNGLELYYEREDWADIFARGRGDQDRPFRFDEPAPEWSAR